MVAKSTEPKVKKAPIVFNDTDSPEMYDAQNSNRPIYQSLTPLSSDNQPSTTNEQSRTSAPSNISRLHQAQNSNYTPSEYYFYQALLHYYLSPLDIRILKVAFGAFSSFPSTILPRIEHISTGHIIDDELRKRTKYLAHLPSGCEVAFLECDWTDTVAPDVLARFAPDIDRRRKRNQEKLSREEKSRIRAEKEEVERYRRANPSAQQSKRASFERERFSADDFAPLGAGSEIAGSPSFSASATVDDGSASTSPPYRRSHTGSAFASLASPSTSPSASRTVWGTAAIAPSSPSLLAQEFVEPVDDGWLHGWEEDLLGLREEDVAAQMRALGVEDGVESGGGGGGGGGIGGGMGKGKGVSYAGAATPTPTIMAGAQGKKGKKKKITLMSTNVRRGA